MVDPAQFFSASRVVIVAGKGGVGKTVVAGAVARAAARYGIDTTIVEIEGRCSVAASFAASPFGYHEVELLRANKSAGRAHVRGRTITPDLALIEYLEDHGLRRIARRMAATGVLEVVATATPGIKDLLVLGKVKHIEQSREASLLVLDAPAAGHALSFLDAARVLHDTAKVGPIHHQAVEVLAMLRDPARTQAMLVTLAEETPINELIETAYRLEDQLRVALGPIIVKCPSRNSRRCAPLVGGGPQGTRVNAKNSNDSPRRCRCRRSNFPTCSHPPSGRQSRSS
ncbi:MAG: hypothetical protein E6G39_11455 [Actinobacteria bacterium]|nr:MAG: hypothetical protein E6G39_11455 [Actinomycetota bacterium]